MNDLNIEKTVDTEKCKYFHHITIDIQESYKIYGNISDNEDIMSPLNSPLS